MRFPDDTNFFVITHVTKQGALTAVYFANSKNYSHHMDTNEISTLFYIRTRVDETTTCEYISHSFSFHYNKNQRHLTMKCSRHMQFLPS